MIPSVGKGPLYITSGADGNMWFTEGETKNLIGRITSEGVITEFAIPTPTSKPAYITAGPDGNMWFAEGNANKVAQLQLSTLEVPTLTDWGMIIFWVISGVCSLHYLSKTKKIEG